MRARPNCGGRPPLSRNATFRWTYGDVVGAARSHSVDALLRQAQRRGEAERLAEGRERHAERSGCSRASSPSPARRPRSGALPSHGIEDRTSRSRGSARRRRREASGCRRVAGLTLPATGTSQKSAPFSRARARRTARRRGRHRREVEPDLPRERGPRRGRRGRPRRPRRPPGPRASCRPRRRRRPPLAASSRRSAGASIGARAFGVPVPDGQGEAGGESGGPWGRPSRRGRGRRRVS